MTSKHDIGGPDKRRALLVSAGTDKVTWTIHHYLRTDVAELPVGGAKARVHIFQCFRTGVERVWGYELLESDAEDVN